ncbi:MAG: hypothetical protein MUE82_13225, partial [Chloroflexi bacterium]|nr:hypothetical protein [Chloroflexota bacterium]
MTTGTEEARPTDPAAAPTAAEPFSAAAAGPAGTAADRAARAAARKLAAEARAARRGPADLPLAYATEATIRARAAAASEPAWLVDDRLAGLARHAELPL